MAKFVYFTLSCFFLASMAAIQEMRFYSEVNQQGDGIILRNSHPDLSSWVPFLETVKSVCVTGWWNMYRMENYDASGAQLGWSFYPEEANRCINRSDFGDFRSARRYGPKDYDTEAIAFYEDTHDQFNNHIYREHLIEGNVGYDFPFIVGSFKTFGNSNWTLFTENMFGGDSICHRSTRLAEHIALNTSHGTGFTIRSVIKGCYIKGIEY